MMSRKTTDKARVLARLLDANGLHTPADMLRRQAEQIEHLRSQRKFVVYDRTESLAHSLASDAVTFAGLAVCIWLSHAMGGGMWSQVTLMMFVLWLCVRLPWERATRTTLLRTKAQARAWAESLPDDDEPSDGKETSHG